MLTGANGERRSTSRVAATVSALEEILAKYEAPPTTASPRRIPLRAGGKSRTDFPPTVQHVRNAYLHRSVSIG